MRTHPELDLVVTPFDWFDTNTLGLEPSALRRVAHNSQNVKWCQSLKYMIHPLCRAEARKMFKCPVGDDHNIVQHVVTMIDDLCGTVFTLMGANYKSASYHLDPDKYRFFGARLNLNQRTKPPLGCEWPSYGDLKKACLKPLEGVDMDSLMDRRWTSAGKPALLRINGRSDPLRGPWADMQ